MYLPKLYVCGVCSAAAKNRDGNANAVDCIPVLQAAEMRCLIEMLLGRQTKSPKHKRCENKNMNAK